VVEEEDVSTLREEVEGEIRWRKEHGHLSDPIQESWILLDDVAQAAQRYVKAPLIGGKAFSRLFTAVQRLVDGGISVSYPEFRYTTVTTTQTPSQAQEERIQRLEREVTQLWWVLGVTGLVLGGVVGWMAW
jgi:hypothetical protein